MGKNKTQKKKKWPFVAAGLLLLVAIILVYAFVITNSGAYLISRFIPDTPEQKMSFQSASNTTQVIADEGFVLLKNEDNFLPLDTSSDAKQKLNIFGMRGVQLVYNAGGSSASNVEKAIKLETALTGPEGNFVLNEDLLNLYYNYFKSDQISIESTEPPVNRSATEFIESDYRITVPELPVETFNKNNLYDDGRTILDHAYDFSDTALIVLGRGAGEVFDFSVPELQLLPGEAAMVDAVCNKFDNVILVLNTANVMELDFINEYPSIKSVVWIGYPGEAGMNSFARILNGTVNPSGRLADTWVADNLAAPANEIYLERNPDGSYKEHSFHYENAPEGKGYFELHSEGIYVGYKYFETRDDTDPGYDYDKDVIFPFGYGLSYTSFEKDMLSLVEEDGEITVRVSVKNTGSVPGKDVIQIYYNPPYTGKIEKSTVNLIAFEKTNIIDPGDTEYYSLTFPVEEMASYDYKNYGSYVLEEGDYEIMLQDNSHDLIASRSYTLAEDIIYNTEHDGKRSTDLQAAVNHFDDALGPDDYLTRSWDPNGRAFTGPKIDDYIAEQVVLDALDGVSTPTDADLGYNEADMPAYGQTLVEPIMFSEMVGLDYDDPKWDEFISQLTLEEMASLSGNGAWNIASIDRLGVPRILSPDGTTVIGASTYSGAIMGTDAKGVTYPTPVVLASTWNKDIAHIMGTSVGNEAQVHGYGGWYAPAMNVHRTPFNGRNFEYYSEDGRLAGIIASNVVQGAAEKGVITFIKHFTLNTRESNDRSYLFSWANEQAIREIYLKPFEMSVKEGGSLGVMSSFAFVGPTWAGGNYSLLTEVLRNEWGFKGAVITDAMVYPFMDAVQMSYAGGDLALDVMGAWQGGNGKSQDLLNTAKSGDREIGMTINLQRSSKNILYAVSQTWVVAE